MENATKALLIAAAVLIVILLIAFGMRIFNSTSEVSTQSQSIGKTISSSITAATDAIFKDNQDTKTEMTAEEFNNSFWKKTYNSNYNLRKSDVETLLSDVKKVCKETNRDITINCRVWGIGGTYSISNIDELIDTIKNFSKSGKNYGVFPDCYFGQKKDEKGYINYISLIPTEGPFIPT